MVGNINNPDTWLIGNSEIRASGFGVTWKDGGDTFFDEYIKGAIIDSVNYGDMTLSITIQDVSLMVIPEVVILFPNYTNPFNSSTIIRFEIPIKGYVTVNILDIAGRQVCQLYSTEADPGLHKIIWDGKDDLGMKVGSGIYIYTAKAKDFVNSKKMTLLR